MAGKFSRQADALAVNVGTLLSRSMRKALLAGLDVAIRSTKHDSSNAGAHWLLAAEASRPASRKEGKLRDLRETAERGRTPPVGKRRAKGAHLEETVVFVRNRETEKVLGKYLTGRKPAAKWFFFNAVGGDEEYAENASIQDAGDTAVTTVLGVMEKELAKGNARKRPL